MISVRAAVLADIPELVRLGRLMHAESPRFNKYPFNAVRTAQVIERMLAAPGNYCILVVECDGETGGMACAFVYEHFFCDAILSSDIVMFVEPKWRGFAACRRLVFGITERLKEMGAVDYAPGISTEVQAERTLKLYEAFGFKLSGYIMRKDL